MPLPLHTTNLTLRPITLQDREELFQLHADPLVQQFTGEQVVETMEEIEQSIQQRLHDYRTYGFGRLAVIETASNAFVGWAGLAYLPEFDKVDIGYRFKQQFWGKGYATEASKALLHYGFRDLKLDEIIAIALPENKASIRVMQKAGMVFDAIAPYDEAIREAVWYKLSREEYVSAGS